MIKFNTMWVIEKITAILVILGIIKFFEYLFAFANWLGR